MFVPRSTIWNIISKAWMLMSRSLQLKTPTLVEHIGKIKIWSSTCFQWGHEFGASILKVEQFYQDGFRTFEDWWNKHTWILECAQQHFGTQSSFWIKVMFYLMFKFKELDKINVHKVYDVHFFKGHKVSYLWFMTHYETKRKMKK
jgi:hypothetical protein